MPSAPDAAADPVAPGVVARVRGRLPRTAGPLAVAGVALVGAVTLATVDPNVAGRYPTCPFLAATGWFCPGCGTLRALHALLHGDVVTAVGLNVLTVSLLPLLAWGWVGWLRAAQGRRDGPPAVPQPVAVALSVAVPVFWLLRNLPFAPLTALAP